MLSRLWNTLLLIMPMTGLFMVLGFVFTLFAPGAIAFAHYLIPIFLAVSIPLGVSLSWKFAPAFGRWLAAPGKRSASLTSPARVQGEPATGLRHPELVRQIIGTHAIPQMSPAAVTYFDGAPFPSLKRRAARKPAREYADWLA